MTFLEERDFSDVPLIPEYFWGKTVFITGGSGFIGKLLIEKLLYSCSELDRIYLLLRSKKGIKPEERKNDMYKLGCFDRLRSEKPDLYESKVFIIPGDASAPDLGISEDDRALLVSKTNIIFHSAASVRFDDILKVATELNLVGTQQVIKLAKDVHNLESFIHVSTAFSNKYQQSTQEILYDPIMDWRELIEICKNDDHTIQVLTPKIMGDVPNTYVFTKHLAEHMVYEEKGKLPIVIVRPSIVIASLSEPVVGWNDNFNGPTGIIVALGSGLTSILYVDPDIKSDYVPVDLVVRAIISAAWARGTKRLEASDDIIIYNACSGGHINMSPNVLLKYALPIMDTAPVENVIMPPSFNFTNSRFKFIVHLFATRIILYFILDLMLKLFSKKPRLIKLIRKIYIASIALENFTQKEWTFEIDNLNKLRSVLKEGDVKEFSYPIESIDPYKYIYGCILGGEKYLLGQNVDQPNLSKMQTAHARRKLFFTAYKIFSYSFIIWFIIVTTNITKTYISKIINF